MNPAHKRIQIEQSGSTDGRKDRRFLLGDTDLQKIIENDIVFRIKQRQGIVSETE